MAPATGSHERVEGCERARARVCVRTLAHASVRLHMRPYACTCVRARVLRACVRAWAPLRVRLCARVPMPVLVRSCARALVRSCACVRVRRSVDAQAPNCAPVQTQQPANEATALALTRGTQGLQHIIFQLDAKLLVLTTIHCVCYSGLLVCSCAQLAVQGWAWGAACAAALSCASLLGMLVAYARVNACARTGGLRLTSALIHAEVLEMGTRLVGARPSTLVHRCCDALEAQLAAVCNLSVLGAEVGPRWPHAVLLLTLAAFALSASADSREIQA